MSVPTKTERWAEAKDAALRSQTSQRPLHWTHAGALLELVGVQEEKIAQLHQALQEGAR